MKTIKPKATKPAARALAAHPRPKRDPDKPKPVVPIADPKPAIA